MSRIDELTTQLRLPSQLQKIQTSWAEQAGIQFLLKRDDAIHPHICGNKWRKLKYALLEALDSKDEGVITYGGAYSNHLVAVAAAANKLQLPSCGIVRSYERHLENPTLEICRSYGMELYFTPPNEYKLKGSSVEIRKLMDRYPNYKEIPEGGTQESALKGVGEIVQEIYEQVGRDTIAKIYTPIGSGGTLAGLAVHAEPNTSIIGISPFKGEISMLAGIELLKEIRDVNWSIAADTLGIRFGAYSKVIIDYLTEFYSTHGVVLDPIYTVRTMMKIEADCKSGILDSGSTIIMIHTGGLQGCYAYNHQYRKKPQLISASILQSII